VRISEKYERDGYFWLPENPDRKIPGTLKIYDGGKIELELIGLLDKDIAVSIKKCFGKEDDADISRIVGQVEKDGPVTLENCIDIPSPNIGSKSIPKSLVHVEKAFCGIRYEQNESAKFNSMTFSVEGLDEWLGIRGINVAYGDDKTTTITCKPQKEMVYELMNGFKLHIGFGYKLLGFPHIVEAKVSQKAHLKLSSVNKERDFQDFIKIIRKITHLLCFAIDATVTISDVVTISDSCFSEMPEGKNSPVPIHIYYGSLPFSLNRPKIDPFRMLFKFSNIEDNVEFFKKWLEVCLKIQPSINLYFSAVTGNYRYMDGRFLALVHALEVYHRRTSTDTEMGECEFTDLLDKLLSNCLEQHKKWLRGKLRYGNEISLSQRIKRLIEPYKEKFGSSDKRKKLINDIVNTRNYFTHYSKCLEEKAVTGKDLYYICLKMEAIFQLHLLQQFDFDESKIEKILQNNYRFQRKIKSSIEN